MYRSSHWSVCLVAAFVVGYLVLLGDLAHPPQAVDLDEPLAHSRRRAMLELGRQLFFDARLSADGTVSCATCHRPEQAFADGRTVAEGVYGRQGTRNTPSLRHTASTQAKFWDGRRPSLETQVLDPFVNPQEHGLPDHAALIHKLQKSTDYDSLWRDALDLPLAQADLTVLSQALSTYILSLQPANTRLDRYLFHRETTALRPEAQRGLALFLGRAQCAACHHISATEAALADGAYHSLGLGFTRLVPELPKLLTILKTTPREAIDRLIATDAQLAALGRFVVTGHATDIGKFKTPSLRNVADTAPYMHDGSVATLEEAVERELYYRGRVRGRPLGLSLADRSDLLAFLRALSDAPAELP
ncbi:MAG: cytochrome c family protein [Candidatus Tectomicrobia bacterium]|uniref:Cytochrome c family protein n=1 Tax=Tectimicrobiota bacterium TaxID=2528274 RepID=A0A937W781_UNCTE|nr:cytochrome c family protein [Candidatus Tectomicrobia bacterium]